MNFIINFVRRCIAIIKSEKISREGKYEVISHEENFEGSGSIYVKIRLKGMRNTFWKSISVVYQKEWLNNFSREDGAFIAVLYVAEQQKDPSIINLFPRKKQIITKNVVLLGMIFVSFLIISNLTAFKVVELNLLKLIHTNIFNFESINFPAALVFFPLTYFIDDNLTEVYGFKVSRFIIWCGLVCSAFVSIGIWITVHLNPSHYWHYQHEYETIFNSTPLLFLASSLGYFIGEMCNSAILSKVKIMTSGRWLWLRVVSSTSVAVAIDSIIFCNIAFWGVLSKEIIWQMIATQYIFKVGYELLALPLTYLISGYLKKADDVDYYDYKTSFNPFSLKVDD